MTNQPVQREITVTCSKHRIRNCVHSECRRERDRRTSVADADTSTALSDPTSPLHQATYGGMFYGSTDTSSSDCGSSSSSSDSGSSSSSYDSGSSSSSCDSY